MSPRTAISLTRPAAGLASILALLALAAPAPALAVSGTLGLQYGPPLALQTTQSDSGGTVSKPAAQVDFNTGSELDAAYGYVSGGTLYLFFTGNLQFVYQLEGGGISHCMPLDVFIDCVPGGQQQLLASNPTVVPFDYDLTRMSGLRFDAGFEADYWLSIGVEPTHRWPYIGAVLAVLPTGGGGSGAFLGQTLPGSPGVLSGGVNPDGIEATFDDSNAQGLGSGCGVPTLSAVQTGIEWAIPLAAIGNPAGCIRVCAFVSGWDHSMVTNQVMGPIPPGTCSLVPAGSVDFSTVPGAQYVTICTVTSTSPSSWGRLKTLYR